MKRPYDSSGRLRRARETRRRILDAAVELHRAGVTELRALADASGVPFATVRKHFPTKEHVFRGCTQHFFESFDVPDFDDASDEPLRERVARVVPRLTAAHEEAHELVWLGLKLRAESDALEAATAQYRGLVAAGVESILAGDDLGPVGLERARLRLTTLLDPLTYRALRLHAGATPDGARDELIRLALAALGLGV